MTDTSAIEPSATTTRETPRWGVLATRALTALGIAIAVGFALLAVEYAQALAASRTPLLVKLVALSISPSFAFGPHSTLTYMHQPYTQARGRISSHMLLGSVALGLGAAQFVPSLRHRAPRLHRWFGLFVWVAVASSMVSALAFLLFIPMRQDASGPAFHLGLWSLTVLTLILLWQAVVSAWRRDFRSHMVWMATVYAALLTAPALRIGWFLWGHATGLDQETVNLACGMFVLLATLSVMTCWLWRVGDRNLPLRVVSPSKWPRWLLWFHAVASAGAALALVLPIEPYAHWQLSGDVLPRGAWLWAGGTVLAMLGSVKAWQRALVGHALSRAMSLAVILVALGAIAIGVEHDRSTLARYATAHYFIGYGGILLVCLLTAHLAPLPSTRRNVGALIALALLWLPSQLPNLLWIGKTAGANFDAAMAAALVNGSGGIAVVGIATSFAATFRLK